MTPFERSQVAATPVVLLDADGVVQRRETTWRERTAAALGVSVDGSDATPPAQTSDGAPFDLDGFLAALFAAERRAINGAIPMHAALTDLLQAWPIEADIDRLLDVWRSAEPVPDILHAVQALRADGVTVCLATNQNDIRAGHMRGTLGYDEHFDHCYFSCEVGAAKPEPAFFERILAHLDCAPDSVLFIDDNQANVDAALAAGMQAHTFALDTDPVSSLVTRIDDHLRSMSSDHLRSISSDHLRSMSSGDGSSGPSEHVASAPSQVQSEPDPVRTATALRLSGLVKRFGDVDALRGLDLCVNEGDVYGLLGRNGAGKSTALRIVMGIMTPSAGQIEIAGGSVRGDDPAMRRLIGYVAQEQHFYGWMTPQSIGKFVAGFYPTWDDDEYRRLLDVLDVPMQRKISHFSGGMQPKLALALALAHRPQLLVLDEPTAAMDAVARREFIEIVHDQAQRSGRTTLFSSHLIDEVELAANRVGIIDAGTTVFEGSLEALRASVRTLVPLHGTDTPLPAQLASEQYEVLRDDTRGDRRQVMARDRNGSGFDGLQDPAWTQEQPSLEDIFVALVTRTPTI